MRTMHYVLCGALLCAVAACGNSGSNSNDPNNTTSPVTDPNGGVAGNSNSTSGKTLTITGTLTNLAFDGNALTNDANNLVVEVLNPNALYPNGMLNTLSPTPIAASDCTVNGNTRTCQFSIKGVKTSGFNPNDGLLIATSDSRASTATGDTTVWQTLATFVPAATVQKAMSSGTLTSVSARILSMGGYNAINTVAGNPPPTGGLVIIDVANKDGSAATGATVTAAQQSATDPNSAPVTEAYADAGMTKGAATGPLTSSGIVVASPKSGSGAVAITTTLTGATFAPETLPDATAPLWVFVPISAQ